jgi:hypothetical protein
MKNSDETIDRVLSGLREVDPPQGMERRIAQTLQLGVPERRYAVLPKLLIPSRFMDNRSWPMALVSAAIVASVIAWTSLRPHRISHETSSSQKHPAPANVRTPNAPLQAANSIQRFRKATTSSRPTSVRAEKSISSHELAANHPAPEAPLTEQEKLLLKIAHRSDPQEIAALNPLLWSARDAEEKAEVKTFFEPAKTGDDK